MEKPKILVKTKSLQQIFDYCIETKTGFTVIPTSSNEDWEIELNIKNIIEAVKWGIYLKTNKIELVENLLVTPISLSTKTTTNNQHVKHKRAKKNTQEPKTEVKNETTTDTVAENPNHSVTPVSLLSFDENSKQSELF